MASREVKKKVVEKEEGEVKPGTSGGGKIEGQVMEESDIDSEVEFDDEFIEKYCEKAEIPEPMTVAKELFYTDAMVEKRYAKLSDIDKIRFDQMKVFAAQIKREMGECNLIEDLMAKVVSQGFGSVQMEDVKSMLGHEGEGAEGGKVVERAEEGYLRIKKEPGVELDRVVVSAVVPCEDPAVLHYAVVEDEQVSDCFTIGSDDSDVEEINKVEVKEVLKN